MHAHELLVSCVIPVWNGERYLAEAIDSVLGQSLPPDEVLLVDDGSTDASASIAARYGASLRWISQPRQGPAAARNRGLRAARGELVAFLDQDDLWHPRKLELQVARFRERPEMDLCLTRVQKFWSAELEQDARFYRAYPRARAVPGYVSGALLARRAIFERVGGFDPARRFSDSADWFLRAREYGAVTEVLPRTLLYHRQHPRNLTRLADRESRGEFLGLVKAALDRQRQVT